MVRAEARQFLPEILLDGLLAAAQILGQLRGDLDLIPHLIALKDLAHRRFAVAVDVGGIVIVDPGIERRQHFLFGLIDIDLVSLLRKAHAAEAEDREFVSVFVFSVLHEVSPKQFSIYANIPQNRPLQCIKYGKIVALEPKRSLSHERNYQDHFRL